MTADEYARKARRFWLREARAQVRRARDLKPFLGGDLEARGVTASLRGAFDFSLETARLFRHWARTVQA